MSQPVNRKLAAIVSTDIVGYSRLMGADEAETLARMKAHRAELWDPQIKKHGGRLVGTAGDSLLVEFASAVSAVECSLALQAGMSEREAGQSEEKRMLLRVGINIGEVVVDGDDIFGDGVNVAARLEGIAPAGGICLSGKVHEEIAGKIDAAFEDAGTREVKNIARPVQVWIWTESVAATGKVAGHEGALPLPDRPSIAVLPFQNMSGDPEQEYFADGLTEDIITGLSRLPSLFVIARHSSFTYKGRAIDIRHVARELGVRYVLEGSVRHAGKRVRITGQLIDATTGGHIWADRFDGDLEDVFELQDRVTESVIGAIQPKLQKAEIDRSRRKRPESMLAYDLYLRSLPHLYAFTPENCDEATSLLRQAVEMSPDYAPALASLAWSKEQRLVHNWPGAVAEDADEIVELARRAIVADRDDADATGLSGFLLTMVGRDHDAGLQAVERALQVNSNSAMVCRSAGWVQAFCGRPEMTLDLGKRLHRLSPSDLHTHFTLNTLGIGYLLLERFEEAADVAMRSSRHQADFDVTYWVLAPALGHLGRMDAAAQAVAKLIALDPTATVSEFRKRLPLHQDGLEIVLDGLRKAGLAE